MDSDSDRSKSVEESKVDHLSEFSISEITGGVLPFVRPIFTPSKKFIIILTSLELRVYLFATRQCVKSISLDTTDIVDIYLNKDDKLWVARKTGLVSIIDLESKSIEKEINFDIPIIKIIDIVSEDRFIFLVGKLKSTIKIVDLHKNIDEEAESFDTQVIASVKHSRGWAISHSGKCFALSSLKDKIETIHVGGLDNDYKLAGDIANVQRTRWSASLAVSNDGILAVGSLSGVIDVYYNVFNDSGKHSQPHALKWHIDAVSALSFSLDNNYIISGGKERVLAFWQLETNRSQLLPRLNGDILSITVDSSNELYALYLSNGEMIVLSAIDLMSRLQVAGLNADFVRLPARKKYKNVEDNYKVPDFTAPHYINPLTGHSYIPTASGSSIQIYDTVQDQQVSTFAIASTIQTGKVRVEKQITDPKVKHVAFTKDGKWMATVDEYLPPQLEGLLSANDKQVNLKFWKYNQADGKWALTTRVAFPHGNGKSILDIVSADSSFHKGHAFLTCCENGGIRLWRPEVLREIQTPKGAKNAAPTRHISWAVRKVLPPLASNSSGASIAWSSDSSMIILGFETTLYVVDAASFEIVRVLPNILGSRVRWLKIVDSHLIVLAKTRLVVYDLVNSKCKWSIRLISNQNGGRLIDVDPSNGLIALAANCIKLPDSTLESRIFLLSTESPVPIYTTTHSVPISNISYVPGSSTPKFRLLDTNSRLITLQSTADSDADAAAQADIIDGFEASLGALYSKQQSKPVVKAVDFDSVTHLVTVDSFDDVFEDSELGVASMSALFDKVLGVLSGPAPSK
ncbi:hypothetical protein DV451_001017 [Geotrichum candidum]|uniref:WD repeat-containing protein 75 second beta-propeller domain-containing protein n=1 Tax=Geotrichum candidum TaxID=1173061 RepID=A0A9P5GA41_GEOCN|nr:hypothetical protein DV451_001017 [Geotrichum candidum]